MRRLNSEKGYTIMELMIVVVVVGILIAIAVPNYTGVLSRARKAACLATQRAIEMGRMYNFIERSDYGASMGDLDATFSEIGFVGDSTVEDLVCQDGGVYTFLEGTFEIKCSIESHN